MPRAFCLALVLLALGACAPTAQDRVREYSEYGLRDYRQGKFGDAREDFGAALAISPNDPDLTYNLGRCHERLGNLDEAERLYRACLERASDHPAARHAWTVLLVETGRQKQAVVMVETWLRAKPRLAGPYIEDGWLRARDGDLDSARARYQQALNIEPRNARALVELAHVYEKLDRPDRAVVLYERALLADPNQPAITRLVSELRAKGVGQPRPD
jgi:tetratricopeptide (TPR) repeat protein